MPRGLAPRIIYLNDHYIICRLNSYAIITHFCFNKNEKVQAENKTLKEDLVTNNKHHYFFYNVVFL